MYDENVVKKIKRKVPMTLHSKNQSFSELKRCSDKILKKFLLENLPINIFLVDLEGYICWVNNRLLKVVNLSKLEEVEGVHISTWDHIRWEYIQEIITIKEEKIREEQYGDHYFSTIRRPIFNQQNKMLGVLGISIEITERKKSEIAKSQFLRNIKHDIRTPLSGIIGLASILKDSISDTELQHFTNSLVETSEALLNLLDRVFESVQFSEGEIPLAHYSFALKNILETVIQLHQAKALEKKVLLHFDYDERLPEIMIGSALRVQRISWELLTNALKYTEKGSVSLVVRLMSCIDDQITIMLQVKDTGLGIPKDKHEIIFEQFTRLTPSWLGLVPGQGLGLFNVKQLIKDLNATMTLESEVMQGSTFTCYIPLRLASLQQD